MLCRLLTTVFTVTLAFAATAGSPAIPLNAEQQTGANPGQTQTDDNPAPLITTPATPIASGSMTVCWKSRASTDLPNRLLIHFHGAPQTVMAAFARSDWEGVLVIVNFPGLSTAYSRPFATDSTRFVQIQQHARKVAAASLDAPSDQWQQVAVSSFSAGYGAVREVLKTPQHFDQISAVIAADSIYAGIQEEQNSRQVNEVHMSNFLRFARLAADSSKTFIISHSAQPTPYASTTETADFLLSSLGITRQESDSIQVDKLRQRSQASQGHLRVLGFAGVSGNDHMQHLHHIDLLWNELRPRRNHSEVR
jgi:hypothetical protein